MISRTAILVGFVALVTGFPPIGSAHGGACDGPDTVTVSALGAAYLVSDEILGEKYVAAVHVYLESNGQPGLQRGGVTLLGDLDVCEPVHVIPDEIIL